MKGISPDQNISKEEYKNSILRLVTLANSHSGAGKLAAQVLLSLFDSRNWHVPLANLVMLHPLDFNAVIISIKGRRELFEPPNNIIPNGDQVFSDLKETWSGVTV